MGKSVKPTKSVQSNKIGNTQNRENREEALQLLDKQTKKREIEGYVWVKKGQTCKQIHPDKLQSHLQDNWRLTKKIK